MFTICIQQINEKIAFQSDVPFIHREIIKEKIGKTGENNNKNKNTQFYLQDDVIVLLLL